MNLWKLEQRPNVGSMLLKLDFQTDVAPRLLFLKDIGVEDSRLGYILSTNPFILTEDLENLRTRSDEGISVMFLESSCLFVLDELMQGGIRSRYCGVVCCIAL